MDNNNPIIPQTPTPSTTSMPEFATAPEAPAPVIPPATAMPEFGQPDPQPIEQPVNGLPVPPVEDVAAEPEPVAEESTKQDDDLAAVLGEITNEAEPTVIDEPQVAESQPAEPASEASVSESAEPVADLAEAPVETPAAPEALQTVSPTPAPSENITPDKKLNIKLIALISAVVILLVGGVVMFLMMNSSNTNNNPNQAPVSSFDETPDNSTPFDKLDKSTAISFLEAVGKGKSYIPDDFLDEKDQDLLSTEQGPSAILVYSYDDKDSIATPAIGGLNSYKKGNTGGAIDSTAFSYDDRDLYTLVNFGEANCTEDCPQALSFDKAKVYYSDFSLFDPSGNSGSDSFIIFNDKTAAIVKRALPIIAYFSIDEKETIVYSAEFTENDTHYVFTFNTLSVGVDQTKVATAEAGDVPYAISLDKLNFFVDKSNGVFYAQPKENFKTISVTAEEVANLL